MTDISQQVLETIQTEHLKPRPRYAVFLKRSVFWSLTGTALVVGSFAVSVTIFSLANTEWDIWSRASGSVWKYAFVVIPYFWLVIFAGFVLLAHYNLRHTKFGYRYSLPKIMIIYAAVTLVAGGVFYRLGLGNEIEEWVAESAPFYRLLPGERAVWVRPDNGLLGGKIENMGDYSFSLTDGSGRVWQVTVSGTVGTEYAFPGARVKIIGERFGTSSFSAVEIRSWCGCGGCDKQMAPSCGQEMTGCQMGTLCGCGK